MGTAKRLAALLLVVATPACSGGGGGGGSVPDPPDFTGTWTGSHVNPGGPGAETLTVVIQDVACGNGICTFDGSWNTATYSAPLDDDYLYDVEAGAPTDFSWSLVYTAGCAGADIGGGSWFEPVTQLQGNTNGDCNTSSFFTLNPPP